MVVLEDQKQENLRQQQQSCEFCELVQKDIEKTKLEGKNVQKLTYTGKIILGLIGATFTGLVAVTSPFLLPALRKICLPYVPATTSQVENVMKLLKGRTLGKLIDLGSGDGRIVIEAAKLGFKAEGVELNPWLVWYSRYSAMRNGVASMTSFYRKDLWKVNLAPYDDIVIFGVEQMDIGERMEEEGW